jgi:nucleotide-binding universal stress UspA family protein
LRQIRHNSAIGAGQFPPIEGKDGFMAVKKILVPINPAVRFERVTSQAIWLAKRYGAELLLLRVGASTWDVDDRVPDRVAVTRLTMAGEPMREIAATARLHNVDLIMMATHEKWRQGSGVEGEIAFFSFLRQSVVAQTIDKAGCPVWVDTGQNMTDAAVHTPLCYLDLGSRSAGILAKAGSFSTAIGAPLTVGHATFSTEIHAPGGASPVAGMWHESFARTAAEKFAALQRQVETDATLLVENGDPLRVAPRLVARAEADLLIVGHWAPSERWARGGEGNDESDVYRMIRYARVPVLIFKPEQSLASRGPSSGPHNRLIANLIIILPLILILMAAVAVGIGKTYPGQASAPRWLVILLSK